MGDEYPNPSMYWWKDSVSPIYRTKSSCRLPIDPELIKKLSTEAQVSALLDLDPDIPLEDAVVKLYQTARVSGAVQELTAKPAMVTLPPMESINIFNPPVAAVLESTSQPAVVNQPPMESICIFNPHVATSPDVFCQPVPQKAPVTDLIEDLFNVQEHGTHHDFLFGTSPQDGDANTDNNPTNMQEKDMVWFGLKVPAVETRKTPVTHVMGVDEPVTLTQVLAEDTTLKKAEGESRSSSSDDSSYLDQERGEKCNEIITLGDKIHYFHVMVVHGTPGAMSIGKVIAIDPDNEYMITVSMGDPIPWESIICRVREPKVVVILWQSLARGNGKHVKLISVRQLAATMHYLVWYMLRAQGCLASSM